MRIVLDTNILISALLSPKGVPWQLVYAWLKNDFDLVTAHEQIMELKRVIQYDHLRERIDFKRREQVLQALETLAIRVDNLPYITLSSDPDDNAILGIAVAGKADLVVSGDKPGMLALRQVQNIPIVSAREALERLGITET